MLRAASLLAGSFLAFQAATAQIHSWKDAEGRIHYGDRPPEGAESRSLARPRAGVVPPGINVRVEKPVITLYDVAGPTLAHVDAAGRLKGPIEAGVRRWANAQWHLDWSYTLFDDRKSCRIDGLAVHLRSDITLPNWIDRDKAAQKDRQTWDRFARALRAHEDGHHQVGVRAANAFATRLRSLGPMPDCPALERRLEGLGQATVTEYRKADAVYDNETRHGATQGAVLYDSDAWEALFRSGETAQSQGEYAKAHEWFRKSLDNAVATVGELHWLTGSSLNAIGTALSAQNKPAEAEHYKRSALAVLEKLGGGEHPDAANVMEQIAGVLRVQGKLGEAEALFRRSLAVREKISPPDTKAVAINLNNLAAVMHERGAAHEAATLLQRALAMLDKLPQADDQTRAALQKNLAMVRQPRELLGPATENMESPASAGGSPRSRGWMGWLRDSALDLMLVLGAALAMFVVAWYMRSERADPAPQAAHFDPVGFDPHAVPHDAPGSHAVQVFHKGLNLREGLALSIAFFAAMALATGIAWWWLDLPASEVEDIAWLVAGAGLLVIFGIHKLLVRFVPARLVLTMTDDGISPVGVPSLPWSDFLRFYSPEPGHQINLYAELKQPGHHARELERFWLLHEGTTSSRYLLVGPGGARRTVDHEDLVPELAKLCAFFKLRAFEKSPSGRTPSPAAETRAPLPRTAAASVQEASPKAAETLVIPRTGGDRGGAFVMSCLAGAAAIAICAGILYFASDGLLAFIRSSFSDSRGDGLVIVAIVALLLLGSLLLARLAVGWLKESRSDAPLLSADRRGMTHIHYGHIPWNEVDRLQIDDDDSNEELTVHVLHAYLTESGYKLVAARRLSNRLHLLQNLRLAHPWRLPLLSSASILLARPYRVNGVAMLPVSFHGLAEIVMKFHERTGEGLPAARR